MFDERCNGVEIVGERCQTKSHCLKGYAPTTGCRIQDSRLMNVLSKTFQPGVIFRIRHPRKSSLISISIGPESLTLSIS